MNHVDAQYLDLLNKVINYGTWKNSRSGNVKSLFDCTMRFNLKEGLPLLTSKKVFYKGIIHELLWFLKGDTNIRYLVENNVHIWDDDAFRFFKSLEFNKYANITIGQDKIIITSEEDWKKWVNVITKDTFVELVKNNDKNFIIFNYGKKYLFGDLGPIYGAQWRGLSDGCNHDQILDIINKLKNNPNDRRIVLSAWNVNDIDKMALPPCHMFSVFYTRELNNTERLEWLWNHSNGEYDEWKSPSSETLDDLNVPKHELSCSFTMRSNDMCCGNPYNIAQYGMLVYMLCEVCNMAVGELVYHGIDAHIYENHIEKAKEQIQRECSDTLPKLKFRKKVNDILDFQYDDFIIEDYYPCEAIKYELNVG